MIDNKLDGILYVLQDEIDEFKNFLASNSDFPYDDSPIGFLAWKEDNTNGSLTILEDIMKVLYN